MFPNFEDLNSSLRVIALPMRTKFRGINIRETAIFEGPYGWGEFAPFLEYEDLECRPWLRSAIEAAYQPQPPLRRDSIPVNGTIPASDSREEIKNLISLYPGVKTFKVKVGTSLAADIARIELVREFAPNAMIRIDVNGSWNVAEAVTSIKAIYEVTGDFLEYVEQPVETLEEIRDLKSKLKIDVKIAGDEILRKAANPFDLDIKGTFDLLVLKVSPLGGITQSLELAKHYGLPVVVSSALESAIGITRGLTLAAALPKIEYACGLATSALFEEDIAALAITDGEIRVAAPRIDALERFEVSNERLEWWRNRIKRTLELIK